MSGSGGILPHLGYFVTHSCFREKRMERKITPNRKMKQKLPFMPPNLKAHKREFLLEKRYKQRSKIHQRTKTSPPQTSAAKRYQFINIHQRTKTSASGWIASRRYQFINIHQRTKTVGAAVHVHVCISLSISIREPKLRPQRYGASRSISLSISIREPKHDQLPIFCRKVSVYQYPSENQNKQ